MTAHSPGLVQGQYFVMMLEVCHTTFVNKTIAKSSLLDFGVRYNPSSLENRYFQRLGCCKPVWETRGNILESFSMVWRCSRIICESYGGMQKQEVTFYRRFLFICYKICLSFQQLREKALINLIMTVSAVIMISEFICTSSFVYNWNIGKDNSYAEYSYCNV